MVRNRRWVIIATMLLLVLASGYWQSLLAQEEEITIQTCMECHSDSSLTIEDEQGHEISLYVDLKQLQHSIHGDLQCTDCHQDINEIPHPEHLQRVNCGSCHETEMTQCQNGIHGSRRLAGDKDAACCVDCHGSHNILPSSDPQSLTNPLNQPKTCGKCHADPAFAERHHLPRVLPPEAYENSVHAKALRRGITNAPSCSDCHSVEGAHKILPMSDPASPVNRRNVAKTCGRCHTKITGTYLGSVHGVALQEGIEDAPTCTNCHGEHAIQSPEEPTSPTAPQNVSEQVCAPCHNNVVLNEKYGLPTDRVKTYESSYHGLAVRRGYKQAANCTSCHGVHDIYRQSDPRSRINPANLDKTCGQCHPGASKKFTQVKIHSFRSVIELKAATIIRQIYVMLIVLVIGGMLIHNLIVFFFYVREKYLKMKRETTVERFDRRMVIQHLLLLLSFTTLVITGFALKYPDAVIFKLLLKIGLDEPTRGLVHRIAGSVLLGTAIYHLFWLFFTRRGRVELWEMLPRMQDITDFRETMAYYLRLSRKKPQFDKYNYIEKAEYWALVWGTAVMGLTGLAMWFPVQATTLFGPWIIPISEIIHFYEAILATLAILVWHFFWVIFFPEEYPLNFVCANGRVPMEEVEKHRPRWLAKITGQAESTQYREEWK